MENNIEIDFKYREKTFSVIVSIESLINEAMMSTIIMNAKEELLEVVPIPKYKFPRGFLPPLKK